MVRVKTMSAKWTNLTVSFLVDESKLGKGFEFLFACH